MEQHKGGVVLRYGASIRSAAAEPVMKQAEMVIGLLHSSVADTEASRMVLRMYDMQRVHCPKLSLHAPLRPAMVTRCCPDIMADVAAHC